MLDLIGSQGPPSSFDLKPIVSGLLGNSQSIVSRMLLHPNVVVTYDCCTGAMDAQKLAKISSAAGPGSRGGAGGRARQRNMTVMVQVTTIQELHNELNDELTSVVIGFGGFGSCLWIAGVLRWGDSEGRAEEAGLWSRHVRGWLLMGRGQ